VATVNLSEEAFFQEKDVHCDPQTNLANALASRRAHDADGALHCLQRSPGILRDAQDVVACRCEGNSLRGCHTNPWAKSNLSGHVLCVAGFDPGEFAGQFAIGLARVRNTPSESQSSTMKGMAQASAGAAIVCSLPRSHTWRTGFLGGKMISILVSKCMGTDNSRTNESLMYGNRQLRNINQTD